MAGSVASPPSPPVGLSRGAEAKTRPRTSECSSMPPGTEASRLCYGGGCCLEAAQPQAAPGRQDARPIPSRTSTGGGEVNRGGMRRAMSFGSAGSRPSRTSQGTSRASRAHSASHSNQSLETGGDSQGLSPLGQIRSTQWTSPARHWSLSGTGSRATRTYSRSSFWGVMQNKGPPEIQFNERTTPAAAVAWARGGEELHWLRSGGSMTGVSHSPLRALCRRMDIMRRDRFFFVVVGGHNNREHPELRWYRSARDFDRSAEPKGRLLLSDVRYVTASVIEDEDDNSKSALEFCIVCSGRSLKLAADDRDRMRSWVLALLHLSRQSRRRVRLSRRQGCVVPSSVVREFNRFDQNNSKGIEVQELIELFKSMNINAVPAVVTRIFTEFDKDNSGYLDLEEFWEFFQVFTVKDALQEWFKRFQEEIPKFACSCQLQPEASAGISESGYRRFLEEVQGERCPPDRDLRATFERILSSGPNAVQSGDGIYLTEAGFSQLICSSRNSVWDPARSEKVFQDMSRPLSHYWIASSHNTYLEGDQLFGHSSLEQYIDVLMRGARCVEIDCWDGDDGEPIVTHGWTATDRLAFQDVIRVCRDYGFVHTSYPLILSLEVHCSPRQLQRMGQILISYFGDLLLRLPEEGLLHASLVSPEDAKNKVILKGKLPKALREELEDAQSYYAYAVPRRLDDDEAMATSDDGADGMAGNNRASTTQSYPPSSESSSADESEDSSSSMPPLPEEDHASQAARISASLGVSSLAVSFSVHLGGKRKQRRQSVSQRLASSVAVLGSKLRSSRSSVRQEELPPEVSRTGSSSSSKARPDSRSLSPTGSVASPRAATAPAALHRSAGRSSLPWADAKADFNTAPPPTPASTPTSLAFSIGRSIAGSTWTSSRKPSKQSQSADDRGLVQEYARTLYLVSCKLPKAMRERHRSGLHPCNIVSFNEKKAAKFLSELGLRRAQEHHRHRLSRVYPAATRIDSRNYDPMPLWLGGYQMVALNYQSSDLPTVVNQGLFSHENGGCGYILKPEQLDRLSERAEAQIREGGGSPSAHSNQDAASSRSQTRSQSAPGVARREAGLSPKASADFQPNASHLTFISERSEGSHGRRSSSERSSCECFIELRVLSGHDLPKPSTMMLGEVINPQVRVSLCGCSEDRQEKETNQVLDNGFNPRWDEVIVFEVANPDVAVLAFEVLHISAALDSLPTATSGLNERLGSLTLDESASWNNDASTSRGSAAGSQPARSAAARASSPADSSNASKGGGSWLIRPPWSPNRRGTARPRQDLVAAAAVPLSALREGLRWVPLLDGQHHDRDRCGLLVHLTLRGRWAHERREARASQEPLAEEPPRASPRANNVATALARKTCPLCDSNESRRAESMEHRHVSRSDDRLMKEPQKIQYVERCLGDMGHFDQENLQLSRVGVAAGEGASGHMWTSRATSTSGASQTGRSI